MAYIPQEEEMRIGLTVQEAMTIAAHLKLGYSASDEFKMNQVNYYISELDISNLQTTVTILLLQSIEKYNL